MIMIPEEAIISYFFPAAALILGLLFGSFYTALADRILYYFYGPGRKLRDKWNLIFIKPSFCFNCKNNISAFYLIPVVGYLISKGKCKFCQTPIGRLRLLGEIFPGAVLLLLVLSGTDWAYSFFTVLFIGHLYISLVTDWKFYILDYENSFFLYLWSILAVLSRYGLSETFFHHGYAFLFTFAVLLILYILGKGEKFGMGDLILAPPLAFHLGPVPAIFLFQLAASLSIIFILFVQKDRHAPSPFGSFMAISFFIVFSAELLYGFL